MIIANRPNSHARLCLSAQLQTGFETKRPHYLQVGSLESGCDFFHGYWL
jgi:hypothetical protein